MGVLFIKNILFSPGPIPVPPSVVLAMFQSLPLILVPSLVL